DHVNEFVTPTAVFPARVPLVNSSVASVYGPPLKFAVPPINAVVPVTVYVTPTVVVPPLKVTFPVPDRLEPAFRLNVPPLNWIVPGLAPVSAPVLGPRPPIGSGPDCTSTVPVFVNVTLPPISGIAA